MDSVERMLHSRRSLMSSFDGRCQRAIDHLKQETGVLEQVQQALEVCLRDKQEVIDTDSRCSASGQMALPERQACCVGSAAQTSARKWIADSARWGADVSRPRLAHGADDWHNTGPEE